ncbi:unnamed protein product [Toxocara canis]|uniref:Uncharacterized protein n=1 Tax=Toxocara canis TaxID=6265 RepID=A0A183U582_TOXCA|nr:unnamed protein product [Toxocara canis]
MDTTQIVGEFGWQHNTDFLPKAASTPMPRSGLHAPQEADGESKLSMSTDFSTTANVFGQAECSVSCRLFILLLLSRSLLVSLSPSSFRCSLRDTENILIRYFVGTTIAKM